MAWLVSLGVVVACGPSASGQAAAEGQDVALATVDVEAKIDPPLRTRLGTGEPVNVLILGARQLLDGAEARAAFVEANSGRLRSAVAVEVIDELRSLAEVEQRRLRTELDLPDDAQGLWIVNLIQARLSPEAVRAVAAHEAVGHVFLALGGVPPEPSAPGSVEAADEAVHERPALDLSGVRVPWNSERIGAARVWRELGVDGTGALVANYDGGFDTSHPDLRGALWHNGGEVAGNGRDDDGNGYVDDVHGYDLGRGTPDVRRLDRGGRHGTWTSGIAVGDGRAGTVTGVAPRARLLPLRGSYAATFVSARVIEYAIESGADVMNMSFSLQGLGNIRGLWRRMADHAQLAGLVLVSGAGNFQTSASIPVQLRIPEGIPSVIGVGGVDEELLVKPYSSMGPVEWGSVLGFGDHPLPPGLLKPDVVAFPGPGYPLLDPGGTGYIDPNTRVQGNSFSGPHAAGVAALMLSAHPELPAWDVGAILERTAADLGEPGKDNATGAGLIDAFAAVREAIRLRDSSAAPGR